MNVELNLPPRVTERAFARLAEINAEGPARPLRVAVAGGSEGVGVAVVGVAVGVAVVGAGLGSALGGVMGAPVDLMAAIGFVAVFAGATNTPLACLVMGIELFGAGHAVPLAIGCFLAYAASGQSSIYLSQRVAGNVTLREAIQARRSRVPPENSKPD